MTFLGIPLLIWGISLAGLLITVAISIGPDLVRDWRARGRPKPYYALQPELLRARIRRALKPAVLLIPAQEAVFSKIGGAPELPEGLAWPIGERSPRVFLAQIDLAAFRAHVDIDWLPSEGRLYFFFDDERNGFADVVRVLDSLDPPGPPANRPGEPPTRWRFNERRVGFMPFDSEPSLDWLGVNYAVLPKDWDVEAGPLFGDDLGDEIDHHIGGYPGEIQGGEMAIECEYMRRGLERDYDDEVPDAIRRAAREWRLLLQIDSDPALNMNWWDGGRLYVFIRAKDAARGDFSKTVTITQTH